MRDNPGRKENRENCMVDLPATVTSVMPQKKRSDRYSLFCGNRFLIGVSAGTLLRFNLEKGVEITPSLYEQIATEESKNALNDYLLRLLARRDHSKNELKTKALQKGFDPELIRQAIEVLDEKQYINDREFARKFASDKISIQQWGPLKIKAELQKRGIKGKTADFILQNASDDLELIQICVDLAIKRKRHFFREPDDFKCKQKVAAYLYQKGFPFEIINRALPEIIDRLNAEKHHS
jgi:regulatory protein